MSVIQLQKALTAHNNLKK